MLLGYLSYGRFLGLSPFWTGNEGRPPSVQRALVELASPLIYGLPIGKRSQLEAIVTQAAPPPPNGRTGSNPLVGYLMHRRQETGRRMGAALLRLQQNPQVFSGGDLWRHRHVHLDAEGWRIFVDSIYAAEVISDAANHNTPASIIRAASIQLYGGCGWLASSLHGAHVGTASLARFTAELHKEIAAAAVQFHKSLAETSD